MSDSEDSSGKQTSRNSSCMAASQKEYQQQVVNMFLSIHEYKDNASFRIIK